MCCDDGSVAGVVDVLSCCVIVHSALLLNPFFLFRFVRVAFFLTCVFLCVQEMTAVVLTLSAAALGIYSAKTGTGVMGRYIEVRRRTE